MCCSNNFTYGVNAITWIAKIARKQKIEEMKYKFNILSLSFVYCNRENGTVKYLYPCKSKNYVKENTFV